MTIKHYNSHTQQLIKSLLLSIIAMICIKMQCHIHLQYHHNIPICIILYLSKTNTIITIAKLLHYYYYYLHQLSHPTLKQLIIINVQHFLLQQHKTNTQQNQFAIKIKNQHKMTKQCALHIL